MWIKLCNDVTVRYAMLFGPSAYRVRAKPDEEAGTERQGCVSRGRCWTDCDIYNVYCTEKNDQRGGRCGELSIVSRCNKAEAYGKLRCATARECRAPHFADPICNRGRSCDERRPLKAAQLQQQLNAMIRHTDVLTAIHSSITISPWTETVCYMFNGRLRSLCGSKESRGWLGVAKQNPHSLTSTTPLVLLHLHSIPTSLCILHYWCSHQLLTIR
jgi:hypothetical protein